MDKCKKIAFFDSGVGGLTVLDKFKKILPNEDCIYFGDLANSPYGDKTKAELLVIADKVFKFLEAQDVKAVVMACNTTSANTYDELKDKYSFRIYPIIQSCAKMISKENISRFGVLATEATVKSGAYTKHIHKYNPEAEVFETACPPWVKIVESGEIDKPENIETVKFYIEKILEKNPQKIILGCTHYPFLLDILSKFAPSDIFQDPSISFAQYVKQDLEAENLLNEKKETGNDEFYVSASAEEFKKAAGMFYHLESLPVTVNL